MNLTSQWDDFLSQAQSLWDEYLQRGPGRLPLDASQPLEATARELLTLLRIESDSPEADRTGLPADWHAEAISAVQRIGDLASRCARTPQGLCFVSGEAGLIPRPDQHAAFESSLERLRRMRERL